MKKTRVRIGVQQPSKVKTTARKLEEKQQQEKQKIKVGEPMKEKN
jgi:hypothetical protein